MSLIKTEEDLKNLREAGRRLARIMKTLATACVANASTRDINSLAEKLIRDGGDVPALLNYTPEGAERPYPATLCLSINNEVVHGIPSEEEKFLKEGDIVGLDLVLAHKGMHADMAVTVPVGKIDADAERLIAVTKKALSDAIAVAKAGARVGDIGYAIETAVESQDFAIVEELGGHGVGYKVHDEPHIANFGTKGKGERLQVGMAIAIEPIVNEGSGEVVLEPDGYTYKTRDGKRSAHFEHTVYIGENGPEVITAG